ncbi:MAG: putative PDDEXK endonuclease, partial [Candidatus Puniceispirillaceae bacterium]
RRKGANFERELARMCMDELGIDGVKRDIEQYRAAEHGDLIGIDGWTVEAKRYAHGIIHKPEWWQQVETAADASGTEPVLIYKYDRALKRS